jgi:lipopolysaccharide transport system ATP-binding protein
MSDIIVTVENLSKCYLVGHQAVQRERYTALRDVISRKARNMARRVADLVRGRQIIAGDEVEEFWALRDVSFEVKRGQVLGIIGRNGAGKSTLLKILSRITEPTAGRAILHGRIASLLEVGTGFHPELTGRENIFLNGAVLGMRRSEIRRKFDEIVAFAEVERFLDTPVKRYSSGMYTRLAFAVAAHLESEILALDEVLAVGDAAFQKKCLDKMGDVARGGRTVLFVSHNMNAVERLCGRVLYLEEGRLAGTYDNVREGILTYLKGAGLGAALNVWRNPGNAYQGEYFIPELIEVSSLGSKKQPGSVFSNSKPIQVSVHGMIRRSDPAQIIGIAVYGEDDELLFWSFTSDDAEERWPKLNVGPIRLHTIIPERVLNEGRYRVELLAGLYYREWLLEPRKSVPNVAFSIQGGLSDSPYWDHKRPGILAPVLRWEKVTPGKEELDV